MGDLDSGEENNADNMSLSGEEGGASDPEDSTEDRDSASPQPYTPGYSEGKATAALKTGLKNERLFLYVYVVSCPIDELQMTEEGEVCTILSRTDLHQDTVWGPYPGTVQSESSTENQEGPTMTMTCEDSNCWITRLPLTADAPSANCTVYSQGKELFCKLTRALVAGESLVALLSGHPTPSADPPEHLSPPLSLVTHKQHPVVKEEPVYPAALHSEIQLLPQQAGMAAILATAVVNKDIFPCKDCGIWYRSERNLQAHLMYYCASRQKQPAAAISPPQEKPKEPYPNERICPFPQCNKSCPSASSLEIHMRTHSGERPFVCLICLSAFTTKANCERHLKVHTDTVNGVCLGCGFVSTTRDILYSHLVTSHMVCQPGSRSEVYSPGPGLSPGDSGVVLKCQVCGHNSESPSQLQQHVRTHLEVRVPAERSPTPRQSTPSSDHAQPQASPKEREPLACVPNPDSSSPGANGSAATTPVPEAAASLRIKEEPQSDTEDQHMEVREDGEVSGAEQLEESRPETKQRELSNSSSSPKSPATTVKAEPTSPTPGSSPAHVGGATSVLPGGALFLPQYMFNPEAAILPQASEILAKMSEMVHSRIKQGQALPPNSPTAFFPTGPTAPTASATPPLKGATCFECDITFNNINNYYAHKRLYCSGRHQAEPSTAPASVPSVGATTSPQGGTTSREASASPTHSDPAAGSGAESRHRVEVKPDTPVEREGVTSSPEGEGGSGGAGGGRASEGSQSPASGSAEDPEDDPNRTFCVACNIRFSRHENYTVHKRFYCASRHDPSNQRSGHMAKVNAFMPQPIRTRKRKKMYEIHMARTQALAAAAAAATAASSAAASAPSPSVLGLPLQPEGSPNGTEASSPEGDGPIDLSKRPRRTEVSRHSSSLLPALPLSDYHKCTACSISFNSIENYLAHKTYYCPATSLQAQTLEQLHRLKRSASTSPKSRSLERSDFLLNQACVTSPSAYPSAISPADAPSLSSPKGTGACSPMACPYCPNRPLTGDLMEHFRSVHGLVVKVKSPRDMSPCTSPMEEASTSPCEPSGGPRLSRVHRDGVNGQGAGGTASPLLNGGPSADGSRSSGSPQPLSPPRASSLTVSPLPEVKRESHTADEASSPVPPPKTQVISPLQNGNTRFCRLCNIKFSSLSTFIAHKKYYCSSHSAEHVK
uniref:Zinc finger protein, FOG family member 1 n=1 Tax=Periophthalmus magnuspinnatus TaxID=409849 RepID=A0A3B3ZCH7_9GOBI